ncbi:TolC family protein [Prochlorococcus sp. AH-716-D22]|nr:TolC family protein [Prochlorococcus sp. AH-716-D22]
MLRKFIYPIIFLPFCLYATPHIASVNNAKDILDKSALKEEKKDILIVDYSAIENFILQSNLELKSLNNLVSSSAFNISSKLAKRYPTLDLQALGIPKYVASKNYNSNSVTTETSQYSINPSINIRWDLIDPLRNSEIKIAKNNYEIAKNNYDIKRKDLVKEAKSRYHKFQKSYQEIENQKIALSSSLISLDDAQSKFNTGIGTRFEVLEAEAQLARDKQLLNEKNIQHKINKISLREILNFKDDFKIKEDQKIIGFWNYKLNKNINNGLAKNLSLKNINLQKSIKQSQANNFLNANKPNIYISNIFSSSFTKGDSMAVSRDPSESGSSYTNTISLNFSWNIFNGGKNRNSFNASKAEAKAEEYSYSNLTNILRTRINKAFLNLKLNKEKILSTKKEISSTKESLRLSRLRYEVGISTLKDVLVRQKELSMANSKNIDAIYSYNLNLDELERLTFLKISNICDEEDNYSTITLKSICNI